MFHEAALIRGCLGGWVFFCLVGHVITTCRGLGEIRGECGGGPGLQGGVCQGPHVQAMLSDCGGVCASHNVHQD